MTAPASSERTPYRPFATFAFVWAVTSLAHQLAFTFWTETWPGWLLVLAACAVIYRPACLLRFIALVVASLIHLWEKLPFVPNHILYEGMLHVTMLLALGGVVLRPSCRGEMFAVLAAAKGRLLLVLAAALAKAVYFQMPDSVQGYFLGSVTTFFLVFACGRFLFTIPACEGGETFYRRVAPVLRVAVVVMYVWAVIQKLNWDYFNPEVSCAALLHTDIAGYFWGLIPTAHWALMAAAAGSLVFELGIPILLSFRRTRYAGFAAAVFFHLWLSIHPAAGIFSFSSLILGVLVLFLPPDWGQRLQDLWGRQLRRVGGGDLARGRRRARAFVIAAFLVTLVTQGALYLTIARSYEVFFIANRVGFFAFFAWGLWIGACYLRSGWPDRFGAAPLGQRAVPTLAWVGLVPVLLNGVWPWIGGRTQTSFSMYSNLRSEAAGNHMFLRRVDLLGLQADMVEVLTSAPDILGPSSKPRGIQQFANPGHRVLPWFEFRRLVSEMEGDFEVDYVRNGTEASLGRKDGEIHGDPEAFVPLPLWQRKFVWFRRLESLDEPMRCTH